MTVIYTFGVSMCIALALGSINTALMKGHAGVSVAILHTNAIIFTVFAFVFFAQDITLLQGLGVILAFIGLCVIALEDKLRF